MVAAGFIGAAIDVTAQRHAEAAIRASEAQFRSFTEQSRSLIWIADPEAGQIIYRSPAFERIWGVPCSEGPSDLSAWMREVHPDDRRQVERSMMLVKAGEAVQSEYRIIRPKDGAIRWLRETSFPIRDGIGAARLIGGITADLSQEDERQIYIVSAKAGEGRRIAHGAHAAIVDAVTSIAARSPAGLGFKARVASEYGADLLPPLVQSIFADILTMTEAPR